MSFGKKSSTQAAPQPTATPVAAKPTEINRYATNPEARDRADNNASASLLAPPQAETEEMKRAKLMQGGAVY